MAVLSMAPITRGANRPGRGSTIELAGGSWACSGDKRPSFSARGAPTSLYISMISIVRFRCVPTHTEGRRPDRLLTMGSVLLREATGEQ